MIIRKLILKEGLNHSSDVFSKRHNLIYSDTNTKGKSTYLRLLFYSLGFPIPSMRGIDFDSVEATIIFCEKGKEFTVNRKGKILEVLVDSDVLCFVLPSEHEAFLSYVFQYNNSAVIRNLLGFLYIDQDKGWSLLNRGTVVGRVKFNIEELLAGLNHVDISDLLDNRRKLEYQKNKFSALIDLQKMSEQIYEANDDYYDSDSENELSDKISYIDLEIKTLSNSLNEINTLIRKEKQFYNYIDSMKLYVRGPEGEIPVKRETLVYAPESTEFLKARQSIISTDIEKLKRQRRILESSRLEQKLRRSQLPIDLQDSASDIIDRNLASFSSIDQEAIFKLLSDVKKELRKNKSDIKSMVKNGNNYISKIYGHVFDYATRLKVDDKIVQKEDYIFTNDLKSIGGAVLQKIVFAFKLAFLKVIEEEMNTKLFIVIDSPKSKELDDENTRLIMQLITEELKDNQVFIASIYDFKCDKRITIQNCAIEDRV